jgi:hypothetical protein
MINYNIYKDMGKMKNIFIQMQNEKWEGTPAEYLKKVLKLKENAKKHILKENK